MILRKCAFCKNDFDEKDLQISHDVPCYLFEGKERRLRKKEADKFGRHLLCKSCHATYEGYVAGVMIGTLSQETKDKLKIVAKSFSENYFKKGDGNDSI